MDDRDQYTDEQVICPRCGAPNPPTVHHCVRCQGPVSEEALRYARANPDKAQRVAPVRLPPSQRRRGSPLAAYSFFYFLFIVVLAIVVIYYLWSCNIQA